jgi:acetyl-CoA acyltransferase
MQRSYSMSQAYVVDGVRTPIGRYGGALSSTRPDDLAASAVASLVKRAAYLDPSRIDDVWFGAANGAGEDNRNVARMAVLLAGLPPSIPGATVNRLCGSGMEAVIQASRSIEVDDASVCVAGGVESMSRAPWVLPKPEQRLPRADATLHSSTLGWRMVNPAMPDAWTVSLGAGAEILADRYGITREQQDSFALASHLNADVSWSAGKYADEVVSVSGASIERDESIRADSTLDRLGSLSPAFRPNGTVTAGNSSPLSDGAAALLLANEREVDHLGVHPLARIASRAVSAVEPQLFGIGPVEAARTALKRAGISWSDLAVVELNEAFAAQSLACLAEWPELDPTIVNPQGGAIALGHPLGSSGARIIASLAWQLKRRGGGFGLAAMCIGVGQGIAIVLEA